MADVNYTRLPLGRIPGGGCIAKCPKCGRKGHFIDCGKWGGVYTHVARPFAVSATGDLRGGKDDVCVIPGSAHQRRPEKRKRRGGTRALRRSRARGKR